MSRIIIPTNPNRLRSFIKAMAFGSALATIAALGACSSNPDKNTQQQSEQQYFNSAQKSLEAGNYLGAIDKLRELQSRFPFGRYAIQSQLDLIGAHYQSGEYEATTAVAERFIREHPAHPKVDFARYMKGLANFDIDRGFLTRLLPSSPAERNLNPIKTAFANFSELVEKHPESSYAADARQRMIYCRNLLAEHQMHVANYYFDRKAYVAALNRAKAILTHYPLSPEVPNAMQLSVKAYKKLGMNDLATKTQGLFEKNFGNESD